MEIKLQFGSVARPMETFTAAELIDDQGALRPEVIDRARTALQQFKDLSFQLSSESNERWQESNRLIRALVADLCKQVKHPYGNIHVFRDVEFQTPSSRPYQL